MAVNKRKTTTATKHTKKGKSSSASNGENQVTDKKTDEIITKDALIEEHLPPIGLVAVVLLCSGALFVLCMRDFLATGKIIGGKWDEAMLSFTKSMDWFDDTKGWKSQQGGISAIKQATTDENNMGGFFVRKMAGAIGLSVHLQKLLPLLAHPARAQWSRGHFHPLLWTAIAANLALAIFHGVYLDDLHQGGADDMGRLIIGVLVVESVAMIYFVSTSKPKKGSAVAMADGKTPDSVSSRIVSRTVAIVTSVVALVSLRDLFFPGFIFPFFPHDDIYLEWTNVLLHSPPAGSQEAMEHGLEAPLYVGDKFVGQLMALNILICCMYKAVSAFAIRYGNDGGGTLKARMIWRGMFVGDALMLFVFRLFVSSALTASLDLRWHIMALCYEAFILGIYGFF